MPNDIILDSSLFVRLDFTDPLILNQQFGANPAPKAQLANTLLLYDTVAIPTYDLGIVPILAQWMGADPLLEALETQAFKFVRRRGMLAYLGNGNGIQATNVEAGPNREPFPWQMEALFGETDGAIERQVQRGLPSLPSATRSRLIAAVRASTVQPAYDDAFFDRAIAGESYLDVLHTPWLASLVRSEFPTLDQVALHRLPNVKPNEFRILGSRSIRDTIDLLLRIADLNVELFLASSIGWADLFTVGEAHELLRSKLRRFRVAPAAVQGFIHLLEFAGVPDLGRAVLSGDLTLETLVALRQEPDATEFRQWLRTVPVIRPEQLTAAYIRALSKRTRVEQWPTKLVRLALTTAAGGLGPIAGAVAGVADSFFVDKWLTGYSPRLFLDQLHRLELPKR